MKLTLRFLALVSILALSSCVSLNPVSMVTSAIGTTVDVATSTVDAIIPGGNGQ